MLVATPTLDRSVRVVRFSYSFLKYPYVSGHSMYQGMYCAVWSHPCASRLQRGPIPIWEVGSSGWYVRCSVVLRASED